MTNKFYIVGVAIFLVVRFYLDYKKRQRQQQEASVSASESTAMEEQDDFVPASTSTVAEKMQSVLTVTRESVQAMSSVDTLHHNEYESSLAENVKVVRAKERTEGNFAEDAVDATGDTTAGDFTEDTVGTVSDFSASPELAEDEKLTVGNSTVAQAGKLNLRQMMVHYEILSKPLSLRQRPRR